MDGKSNPRGTPFYLTLCCAYYLELPVLCNFFTAASVGWTCHLGFRRVKSLVYRCCWMFNSTHYYIMGLNQRYLQLKWSIVPVIFLFCFSFRFQARNYVSCLLHMLANWEKPLIGQHGFCPGSCHATKRGNHKRTFRRSIKSLLDNCRLTSGFQFLKREMFIPDCNRIIKIWRLCLDVCGQWQRYAIPRGTM